MIELKKSINRFSFLLTTLLLLSSGSAWSQEPTVGLIHNSPEAFPGYTLFSSMFHKGIYLIDNCGKVVNHWEDDKTATNSVYLLEGGNLLRTARSNFVNSGIQVGGAGEAVQILDWDGNVIWEFIYANDTVRLHHDVELMPNGNVLMLAWERIEAQDVIYAGRDPNLLSDNYLVPEHIIEVQPVGADSGTIVWEWHAWDHLIQDFDSTKPNFGVVAEHPELFDLNFINHYVDFNYATNPDWMHANAVSYNPELDQIALSFQRWGEIYIIDHSTTVAEAAGHTGGKYGHGGDLLYRFGNPFAAQFGDTLTTQLWGQHDVKWIPPGLPGAGKLILFNNGEWRSPSYSEILAIDPPQSSPGVYIRESGEYFGPEVPEILYGGPDTVGFYSYYISGVQALPNGNLLICEGAQGELFEVDREGTEVWRYVNPQVKISGRNILSQGDIPDQNENATFRAERYGVEYLEGIDLTPGDPLELNPWPYECSWEEDWPSQFHLYPNPATDELNFWMENPTGGEYEITIWNTIGKKIYQGTLQDDFVTLDISDWGLGLYFVKVGDEEVRRLWIRQ